MPSLLPNYWRGIFNVFAKNQRCQPDLANCWRCYAWKGPGTLDAALIFDGLIKIRKTKNEATCVASFYLHFCTCFVTWRRLKHTDDTERRFLTTTDQWADQLLHQSAAAQIHHRRLSTFRYFAVTVQGRRESAYPEIGRCYWYSSYPEGRSSWADTKGRGLHV